MVSWNSTNNNEECRLTYLLPTERFMIIHSFTYWYLNLIIRSLYMEHMHPFIARLNDRGPTVWMKVNKVKKKYIQSVAFHKCSTGFTRQIEFVVHHFSLLVILRERVKTTRIFIKLLIVLITYHWETSLANL